MKALKGLSSRAFNIQIKIENPKINNIEIKRNLNKSLNLLIQKSNQNLNVEEIDANIYLFIKQSVEKHFLFFGNTKVFLTNFEERGGSLLIFFTLLIIGSVTNYGHIRHSIDYFIHDIDFVFTDVLSREYSISSNYHEGDQNYRITNDSANEEIIDILNKTKRENIYTRILAGIALFLIIALILLFVEQKDEKINKSDIQILINEELQKSRLENKINLIIESLKKQPDSIKVK